MSSMNSSRGVPMHQQLPSLKHACIARCTSASTRRVQTIHKIQIYKSSYGSAFVVLPSAENKGLTALYRPTVSKGKGKGKAAPRKKGSTSSVTKTESSPPATMKRPPSSPPKASAASTPPEPPAQPESSQSTTASGGSSQEDLPPAIVTLEAELYLFNHETGAFALQANVVARIVQPEDVGPYTYFLVTTTPDTRILAHRVASEMNSRFSTRVNSFTWNHESESGLQTSWCLRFGDLADMETFKLAYSKALYETLNRLPWEKIKVCSCHPRNRIRRVDPMVSRLRSKLMWQVQMRMWR